MSNRKAIASLRACLFAATFAASLMSAATARAEPMYTWRDANGVKQYSDVCPPGEGCEAMRIGVSGQPAANQTRPQTAIVRSGRSSGNDSENTTGGAEFGEASGDAGAKRASGKISIGDVSFTGGSSADQAGNGVGLLLAWKKLSDADAVGYRVYFAPAGSPLQPVGQGVNVGSATNYVITGVTSGTRYYFRITAYDASGSERVFSNTVYKDVP